MAKATASCVCAVCGATWKAVKICRNRRDADSWAAWATENFTECPDCRESRIKREREQENAAAKEAAETAGLPALTGSEKQVAWATTIRQKAYDTLMSALDMESRTISEMEAAGKKTTHAKESVRRVRLFVQWLFDSHTAASWWIERRNKVSLPVGDILSNFSGDPDFLEWFAGKEAENTGTPA